MMPPLPPPTRAGTSRRIPALPVGRLSQVHHYFFGRGPVVIANLRLIAHGLVAVFIVLLCLGPGSRGPTARADDVDDYVEAQRVQSKVPGLALLVVRDGQIVKARGYGL